MARKKVEYRECDQCASNIELHNLRERMERDSCAEKYVWRQAARDHQQHSGMRAQGSPPIPAGSVCASCRGWVNRWGGIYREAFKAGWDSRTTEDRE